MTCNSEAFASELHVVYLLSSNRKTNISRPFVKILVKYWSIHNLMQFYHCMFTNDYFSINALKH